MKFSSYIPCIFCHHQYFPDWNYEVKDGCRKNKWNENIEKMVSTLWKWLKQFSCHVVELFSFYGLSQWLQFALTFIHAQFCHYNHFSTSHKRNCKKVIVKRFCRSCQRVNWFGQHPNFSFSSACCTFCSMIIILLEGRVSTIIGGLVLPLHLAQFFSGNLLTFLAYFSAFFTLLEENHSKSSITFVCIYTYEFYQFSVRFLKPTAVFSPRIDWQRSLFKWHLQ